MTDEDFDKEFDKFVEDLQNEIMEKEIEDYNEYIVKLFHNPINWGKPKPEEITVEQEYKGPCGDTMIFFLTINDDNQIEKAHFLELWRFSKPFCG